MIKYLVRKGFNMVGLDVHRCQPSAPAIPADFPLDFEPEYVDIIKRCRPYTMTTNESLYQLILCTKYIAENEIPGDFVECGVWRGGSILAMIEALKLAGDSGRRFHLFDTFSSADMFETNEPTDEDQPFGSTLEEMMNGIQKSGFDLSVELAGVRGTIAATGYASDKIMFHVGRTEDTIGSAPIEAIGLLRLDTDWYDSTRDQLE